MCKGIMGIREVKKARGVGMLCDMAALLNGLEALLNLQKEREREGE